MPLLCHYYATTMPLLCHYYATTMPLLCHYYATTMPPAINFMPLNSQKGSYYATHYASIVQNPHRAKLCQAYAGRIAKWQTIPCLQLSPKLFLHQSSHYSLFHSVVRENFCWQLPSERTLNSTKSLYSLV
jgi:hypothetical protein